MQPIIKNGARNAEKLPILEKGQRNDASLHGKHAPVDIHKEPVV